MKVSKPVSREMVYCRSLDEDYHGPYLVSSMVVRFLCMLFVNRHWQSHCDKGDEFKGKPCLCFEFEKKGNQYLLDEVSSFQPFAPSTSMHKKSESIKKNFEIGKLISVLLWALKAKLIMR